MTIFLLAFVFLAGMVAGACATLFIWLRAGDLENRARLAREARRGGRGAQTSLIVNREPLVGEGSGGVVIIAPGTSAYDVFTERLRSGSGIGEKEWR